MNEFDILVILLVGFLIGRKAPPVAQWKLPSQVTRYLQRLWPFKGEDSTAHRVPHYTEATRPTTNEHHLEIVKRLPSGRFYWICVCTVDGKAAIESAVFNDFQEHLNRQVYTS